MADNGNSTTVTGRRRGGRSRHLDDAGANGAGQAASKPHYRHIVNTLPPVELLSGDEVEAIHRTSLTMLREIGIRVLNSEARDVFRKAGAEVSEDTMMVRLDDELVLASVSRAPSEIDLTVRGGTPYRIGGRNTIFSSVGGPANFSTLDDGRRPGTRAAFEDILKLGQSFEVIHMIGPSVEPMDIELRFRQLEVVRAEVMLTDKFPFVAARGPSPVADGLEIIRLARGFDEAEFHDTVSCFTVVNVNSPLQLDVPMCHGIMEFARRGQLVVLTPFTLAGAMAPVSVAGALAQQNAEALAGIALGQMVRPGAPAAYGGFTSNVDMRSGAPAFGTPEYVKAAMATGQLARKYGLPWRSSNANASNAPDAQAAYEAQMSIWGALLGGCNVLMHGAGWLEGGLTASLEKFIIDIEMLQMMAEVFQPLDCSTAELALDAVREVGPGGHYFGAAHTLERYASAFYEPLVSDWRNFENWRDAGSPPADVRANRIWKETLRTYEPPAMDPACREAVDAYVERRTAEGGAEPLT